MKKKDFFINMALFLGSCLLGLAAMELIFPHFLNKIPLSLSTGLDKGVRILSQTSKKSVAPRNYIALMGDSNAQGLGDWLKGQLKKKQLRLSTFDYSSAHLLYRRTGRDVISFGSGGSGSLGGVAVKPVASFLYLRSLKAFDLEKPWKILVYFYEGNDLDDNIRDIKSHYMGKYDMGLFYDTQYFKQFLGDLVEQSPLMDKEYPLKNFIFLRFILSGVQNVGSEAKVGVRKLKKFLGIKGAEAEEINPEPGENATQPEPAVNKAFVAGKEVDIPARLQAPSLELTEEEMKKGFYVFEQALLYMAGFFEGSSIGIVYIPAPLSSYQLAAPRVSIDSHAGRSHVFESAFVAERSQEMCKRIEEIAASHNFEFLDTRRFIRREAGKNLIHGPKDWTHLNKDGYSVLTDAIVTAFFNDGKSTDSFGCE